MALKSSAASDEARPQPATTGAHWLDYLGRVLDTVDRATPHLLDSKLWSTIAACLTIGYVATLGLLPEADRHAFAAGFKDTVGNIVDLVRNDTFAWSGWVVATLLLMAGIPFVVYQHRRIQKLGADLSDCQQREDSRRISSQSPQQLSLYEEQARRKYDRGPDDGS